MSLITNLVTTFPSVPIPPDLGLQKISDGLSLAITAHILLSFIPVGFSATASSIGGLSVVTRILLTYLEIQLAPILVAANTALLNPATPIPPLAWQSVRSAVLLIPPPPQIAGPLGVGFWSSVLRTVWEAMPAAPEISREDDESDSEDLDIQVRF